MVQVVENLFTKDSIRTNSGIYVNVFDPTPEMFTIEDIAHALAHQCRFAGHLPVHYSVAQHSVLCARRLAPKHQLAGLLHDGSEAYILDIPTPIKKRLAGYKELEDNLMMVIASKFNFQYPLAPEIKMVDSLLLQEEWDGIMLQPAEYPSFECWDFATAKMNFIDAYYKLKSGQPL